MRPWSGNVGFCNKMRIISGLAEKLLASQEGLFSMVLANEAKDEVGRNCYTRGGNLEERDQIEEKCELRIDS